MTRPQAAFCILLCVCIFIQHFGFTVLANKYRERGEKLRQLEKELQQLKESR